MVFFRAPLMIEIFLTIMLVYEVISKNVPPGSPLSRFFSFQFLGIAPTVALLAVIGTVLFTRSQYAVVTAPALAGHSFGWEAVEDTQAWSMSMYNAGPGLARTTSFRVRLAVNSELPRVSSPKEALNYLERKVGPCSVRYIREISPGYPFKPLSDPDKAVGVFRIDAHAARAIRIFEVETRFVDMLGDEYVWRRDFAELFRQRLPEM